MSTVRAFIAVEINQPNRQKISELIYLLKESNADVKWITENQMHLTLKFLGNIDKARVPEISNALRSISHNFKSFIISLSNIGAFPSVNHPRVIWLGIDKGADLLKTLAEKIDSELEKLGFQKETREFKAHLTLGRVKTSKNMPNLTKLLKETAFSSESDIAITELILFQSTLTPKGAVYTRLSTIEFQ